LAILIRPLASFLPYKYIPIHCSFYQAIRWITYYLSGEMSKWLTVVRDSAYVPKHMPSRKS
jgi:hypothetical protein